ncbi:heptaprenyl diphosphate synthase subunit I [Lysinibacillus sp. PLM2]|nr:heptaprenyl diphosphate synthase subunit I [Lysinibacillus sp. PLM2]
MDATYIQNSIEQLKLNIYNQLHHSTLLKYTGEPVLNNHQLFYLLLPFLNGENWDENLNISAVTIGMVHASLSEHDKIHEQNATSKEQQLTVLSGDFYSGRYYQLLANTGNIFLIRKISEGIVNRCEQQMKVYEPNKLTINEWLNSLLTIETELIKKYYSFYHFEKYNTIMTKSLLLLRLNEELMNYQNGNVTAFIKNMMGSLNKFETIDSVINQEVETLIESLNEYLQTSSVLKDELKLYIKKQIAVCR